MNSYFICQHNFYVNIFCMKLYQFIFYMSTLFYVNIFCMKLYLFIFYMSTYKLYFIKVLTLTIR